MSPPQNPPAFPAAYPASSGGMSQRDWFAGQAIAGEQLPPYDDLDDNELAHACVQLARTAYMVSDAMLAEGAKGEAGATDDAGSQLVLIAVHMARPGATRTRLTIGNAEVDVPTISLRAAIELGLKRRGR